MSSRENKQQLPELTRQILKTYEDLGTINHLGHTPLPQLDKIVAILADFKEVLYPCLLYTSPSPRDMRRSRMPSSA